ncbi:DUF3492 domain-containing protein [Streptomyces sp. NPDC007088]|uniref:DUF3492 domain-containing protein n=1 Tax=Streptomyces sp. NPDC007088 TaxID=3364773 RepID=UPI00367791A5
MRVGLLTDGGYPYVSGEAGLWCDRLVRGLDHHVFDVYALSRGAHQEQRGWVPLPEHVGRVRTAALWDEPEEGERLGRRARGEFLRHFEAFAAAVCSADNARAGAGAGARARTPRPVAAVRALPAAGPERKPGARPGTGVGALLGLTALAGMTAGEPGTGAAPGPSHSHRDGRAPSPLAPGTGAFGAALRGLAELAQETGGLPGALRSETAVRVLERACRDSGALPAAHRARVSDLLLLTDLLERALRPLSLDWYAEDGLGAVDLCHATAGGLAALPGLLAHHFGGVPLLVTEYGVRLRSLYLGAHPAPGAADPDGAAAERPAPSAPVRAVLGGFHRELAAEVYRVAALVTPGNAHARRWQERCGADPARLRTVYPGMDATRFAEVGEAAAGASLCGRAGRAGRAGGDGAERGGWDLVWVGRFEEAKDLASLLRAFVTVHAAEPRATLRLFGAPAADESEAAYRADCEELAAALFPPGPGGEPRPVRFEQPGAPDAPGPELAEVYADADAVVLSSVVEGFPVSLVEAMFCGRATVSTDTGAVVEVVGGTGLVVPPRDPRALAGACLELLRDPERRRTLGAAARTRALELFTVEQNVAAFGDIYLDILTRCPVPREPLDDRGEPLPFGRPAETVLPTAPAPGPGGGSGTAAAPASHRPLEAAR